MEINLSNRVQAIKPSPTLAMAARATALRAEGKTIINLGVGEPDFDTPDFVCQAGVEAIQNGQTRYTPVDGAASFKKAICEKFKRENNLDYQPNQILISTGAKQSLYNAIQALINPEDEVIMAAPYWVSYPDMVILAGGKPVVINTTFESNYKLSPDQLAKAITPKTKMIILNSPSNPSGVAYSKQDFAGLAEVLLAHPNITVVTDDIYEHILFNGDFCNILNACPELYDRTIVVNGVSKGYAMTGWRIGYAGGPEAVIKGMKKVQSQSTSNASSISQAASEAALSGNQEIVSEMCASFKHRHDYVYNRLRAIPGVKCHPSDGTFYIFPDISACLEKVDGVNTDIEFAEYLLEKAGIALVPGSAFGTPGCIRISFAVDEDTLDTALSKLEQILR